MDGVLLLKLVSGDKAKYDEIVTTIEDEWFIENHIADRLDDLVWENESVQHYGFSELCLPRSAKKIPDWIIPFLDIDTIINDNVRSGLILLESIGLRVMETR